MNPRVFISILPVLVFYAVGRVTEPWVAIVAGFVASGIVYYYSRSERLIGALTLFGFAIVSLSAVIGIVSNNEKAYLAAGPIADFLFIGLYLGSIAIKQPLVGGIARELLPAIAGRVPVNHPVFVKLSVAWAVYDLFHGVGRIYLIENLSTGEYLVWSRVLNWPFSGAMIFVTFVAIQRVAAAIALERGEEPPRFSWRPQPTLATE